MGWWLSTEKANKKKLILKKCPTCCLQNLRILRRIADVEKIDCKTVKPHLGLMHKCIHESLRTEIIDLQENDYRSTIWYFRFIMNETLHKGSELLSFIVTWIRTFRYGWRRDLLNVHIVSIHLDFPSSVTIEQSSCFYAYTMSLLQWLHHIS